MKNKYLIGGLFLFVALASVFTLSAFDRNDDKLMTESAIESGANVMGMDAIEANKDIQVGSAVVFNYRLDTITNAESNTLTIGNRDNNTWNTVTVPANFLSLYTYDVKCKVASLSGTLSIKVRLDGCNVTSGTNSASTGWVGLDSITTTAVGTVLLRSTDATATRYRLVVSGTGTESSTYQIWTAWKKKN